MANCKTRQSLFVRARAQGKTIGAAGVEAGYSATSSWPGQLANKPEILARIAALTLDSPITGPDLGPVIAALMSGAETAMAKDNAAAFAAAARMLAEAGRLKQKLPQTSVADARADWVAAWGPED